MKKTKFKSKNKYVLTRHETMTRTEKVQYEIDIPTHITRKREYAEGQFSDGNYSASNVIGVLDSQMIDEENISLRRKK